MGYDLKKKDERAQVKKLYATAGETLTAGNMLCLAPYATYIDMYQTYADTSALVAVWAESNTGETDAALTATAGEFGYGNQGMKITTTAGKDHQTITDTITAASISGSTVYVLGKASAKSGDFLVYLGDGTSAGSAALVFAATDTFEWQSFTVNTTIFAKDSDLGDGNDVDLTAVTNVGYSVLDSTADPTMEIGGIVIMPATETYRMYKADANAIDRMPIVGWAPVGVTSGAKHDVGLFTGIKVTGQSGLIPGLYVYASATAGGVAQFFNEAVGFTRQVLGIAISDTEFLVYSPGGEF